jgi:hypothetical protein
MKQPNKSPLVLALEKAKRAHEKAGATYSNLRSGHAQNPRYACGEFSPRLAQAEADMLDRQIDLMNAEAAMAAGDPDVAALAAWLIGELELAHATFAQPRPPVPALDGYDAASLTAHTEALVKHLAEKAARESTTVAATRLRCAWRAALDGQDRIRAAREAAGEPSPRALVTNDVHAVPVNADECQSVIKRLRQRVPAPDTAWIAFKRDGLLEQIAEFEAKIAEESRLSGLNEAKQRFESQCGEGSAAAE